MVTDHLASLEVYLCAFSALLGFGAQTTAYYIRCHDCHARWAQHPEDWKAWEEEMAETQQKLEAASKGE